MRAKVEVANLTQKKINPQWVKKIVKKTAQLAGVALDFLEISVVFVGEAEMRKLYRRYKGENKSTDVLSFRLNLGYNKKRSGKRRSYVEGEIILCPTVIARDARCNKVSFERELGFVLSHGVLHLLGFRHGKRMYALQDKICENI